MVLPQPRSRGSSTVGRSRPVPVPADQGKATPLALETERHPCLGKTARWGSNKKSPGSPILRDGSRDRIDSRRGSGALTIEGVSRCACTPADAPCDSRASGAGAAASTIAGIEPLLRPSLRWQRSAVSQSAHAGSLSKKGESRSGWCGFITNRHEPCGWFKWSRGYSVPYRDFSQARSRGRS